MWKSAVQIRCQFIILARKDEPTPDFGFPVGLSELLAAASREIGDFEDNRQMALASSTQVNAIVTRDSSGVSTSTVRVQSPAQFIDELSPTSPETTK